MIRERISRYRLLEEIGEGGMGVVYRARDEHLGRDVALKVLRSVSGADDVARKRFRREARALSLLSHPSISTVFDFDSYDGIDFLVMELVEGNRLEDRIRQGPLSEREVADVGAQIAEALASAHEQGIIHRDLKPGNVIVTPKGRVKLLDFGLALLCPGSIPSTETRSLTDTGQVAGTLAYMSPEQLLGQEVNERSDLYSLGVLMFEAVTGRRPFTATLSTALINEILNRPAPAAGSFGVAVSRNLESLLSALLEKDPAVRPGSAAQVEARLRALLAGDRSPVPALEPPPLRAATAGPIESIAVLPLENLSRDPEQEYFADGMTEALITNLAQIGALRVVSRTSAMRFKGVRKPLPEMARALQADAVVEGSVARFGDRVRITAQLIHAATDRHLWAQSYERDLSDVLALQGEVARAIAEEIRVQLSPQEAARLAEARRVDPEAYESYLRGRYHWSRRSAEALEKAVEAFHQAIAKDPLYAEAYAGLAATYLTMGSYNFLPPGEAFSKAKAASQRALEIDEATPEAQTCLGGVLFNYQWDWAGSERAYRRAITLGPNFAASYHWYSEYLSAMGRHEESIETVRKAQALDPLALTINVGVGISYFYARRYEEAVELLRRTLELDATFPPVYRSLGGALEQAGRLDEAIETYEKGAFYSKDLSASSLLAHAYAVSGREDDARGLLRELREGAATRYFSPYAAAAVHVALGEPDAAIENLTRGYEIRDRGMVWLKVSPRFDRLREDARFQALLRRMRLT